MAFSNQGLTWNMADSAFGGGDFDWYDAGDDNEYLSPDQGGYPGGIPGYDDYQQGTTGPVAPDQTPYDPYADEGPSQPTEGVPVNTPGTSDDNTPEITVVGDRPPAIPDQPVVPDLITAPPIELPDLTPYLPEPDIPELVIKAPKPVIEQPPYNPPLIPPGDILQPVPPQEPDVPELVIKDTRPVVEPPVVTPPVITPPDIITPVIPETPVVTPPAVVTPPVVTPPAVVTPPVVTQPPVVQTPQPMSQGKMINPGWIQPTAFYNTTNPAQSKFFWGGHGPQFATGTGSSPFNAQAYNQVAAPETPWGLGQVQSPLSPEDMKNIIAGTYQQPQGTPAASRAEAYRAPTQTAPIYGQVQVGGPTAPTTTPTTTGGATKELYTADQKSQISQQLGANWQKDLDNAALNGDYATIVRIQNQINAILNPVEQTY